MRRVARRAAAEALDAEDRALVRAVDGEMETAARRAGPLFGCGPGRTDCCLGPFPINLLDARRLQRGLSALAASDPPRASAVRRRARAARARHAPEFPGDARSGLLADDEAAEEAFCAARASEPCPALDEATGLCDLYPWRPLACRTLGPPVRIGTEDLPPCPHCFAAASPAELAACRAEPDPEAREDALLGRLEERSDLRGETTIAFALCGRPRGPARVRARGRRTGRTGLPRPRRSATLASGS